MAPKNVTKKDEVRLWKMQYGLSKRKRHRKEFPSVSFSRRVTRFEYLICVKLSIGNTTNVGLLSISLWTSER